MKENARIVERGGIARAVLRSDEADAPSHAARARTLAALGLASAVVATSTVAVAGGKGAGFGWTLAVKWIIAVATIGAATATGVVLVKQRQQQRPAIVAPAATTSTEVSRPIVPFTPTAVVAEPALPVVAPPLTSAPAAAVASAAVPAPTTPRLGVSTLAVATPPPEKCSLGEEIRRLDAASLAIRQARRDDATALLNAYDHDCPAGSMRDQLQAMRRKLAE